MDERLTAFWTASWKTMDPQRLADYAARLDMGGDPITDFLAARGARSVCDAGCGCGAYAYKLARHGFFVSGFDLSADAAALAAALLAERGCAAGEFLAADILRPPFPDAAFDAVVARDVLDHMPLADAAAAVRELLRITRPGGCAVFTLDAADEEYERAPHRVSPDGDYLFTGGKWAGMVFHPYTVAGLAALIPGGDYRVLDDSGGFTVAVEKG